MRILRHFAATLALWALVAVPAKAAGLIRDADVEYALAQIAAPVLRAAGVPANLRILVIDDPALNAFVADNQHIFLNSGLIMKLGSVEALQYVIAHEAAHISNGHLARRAGNARAARTAAGLGMVLAAAAAASGAPSVATGIAAGSQSAALRQFLAHTRAEESSADATALRSLVRAGIDPRAALEVHELFRGQEALSAGRQDPYMRSHPLTRDRMRAAQGFVAGNAGAARDDPGAAYWFARAQGKLSAFLRAPGWTLRRAGASVSKDIALMREAVAYHRSSDLRKSLAAIDQALALRPRDALYLELKGQILLEGRQFGPAVQVYRQAAAMAPNEALILGGLGRAQMAAGDAKSALEVLERARSRDFRDPRILRDLAVAYAKTGQNGMASLVTAERYALQGRMKDARLHATRAEGLLPRGSGPWRRAEDVLSATKTLR
ncbi:MULTISPECIES: M48 family metalloprotease [Marinovum]|uniref:M48 family metalloprotease n=1 Tax=Marinovum TaxID=367771 RepID=UPI00065B2C11|nr:M48 family metalloprotease [Marinovum sp. PR37]AKO96726.1 Putative Zn-dependent protease [Marinovum algicola DG 898]MDD9745178.1 M48 family metalloprotease [Marinovum sp. PR37]